MQALIKDDKETIATMLPKHGEPGGDIYDTGLKVVVPDDWMVIRAWLRKPPGMSHPEPLAEAVLLLFFLLDFLDQIHLLLLADLS